VRGVSQLVLSARDANGQPVDPASAGEDDRHSPPGRCEVQITANIKASAPAAGWITLTAAGADPLTVPYTVTRRSPVKSYGLLLLVGLIASGLILGFAFGCIGLSDKFARSTLEGNLNASSPAWKFSESWASNLTAVGAIAGTVLAASGVLKEFLPQYQTAGVLALNLGLATLIVLAPTVFLACKVNGRANVYGFLAAATLTMTAVFTQITLAAFLFRQGSLSNWIIWPGAVAVAAITAFYVIRTILELSRTPLGGLREAVPAPPTPARTPIL
jgi:hypothetical protein